MQALSRLMCISLILPPSVGSAPDEEVENTIESSEAQRQSLLKETFSSLVTILRDIRGDFHKKDKEIGWTIDVFWTIGGCLIGPVKQKERGYEKKQANVFTRLTQVREGTLQKEQ